VVPVGGGTLDLKISARLSDGSVIARAVTIQLATGEVQELKIVQPQAPLLDQQMLRRRAN